MAVKPLAIELDGVAMHPKDTIFVVYNPSGVPVGTVSGAHVVRDGRIASEPWRFMPRAARSYWLNEDVALVKVHEGYRIKHMSFSRFAVEVAAKMQPEES